MRILVIVVTLLALGGCNAGSDGWTKCPRGFDVPGGPMVNGGRWKIGGEYHYEVAYYRVSENGKVLEWRLEYIDKGKKRDGRQGHYMLKAGQSVGCVDWGHWAE
jgi:hypothetical protein